jgi:hypothetical protein
MPALECTFAELVQQEALLLQPFQHAILSEGEISLMVIDGQFSHAIRKTPQAGDFRVQDDHGGSVHPHTATMKNSNLPNKLLLRFRLMCCMRVSTSFATIPASWPSWKLEMIEPELFFRYRPEAADSWPAD